MSIDKQQAARAFAFTGATLLIGVVVYITSQGLIPFVELPDLVGSVFALGFVLVFLNLSFALGRRFCSRSFEMESFPYILGLLLILPTLILTYLTERLTGAPSLLYFYGLILLSGLGGAFLGIRSGRRKRDKLIREALESRGTEEPDV